MTYDDIIENLSNPLKNPDLINAILMEKSHGKRSNIRVLKVKGDKKADDSAGLLSFDDIFSFESEIFHFILKKYYEAITTNGSKLNPNMIGPNFLREANIAKIKEIAEAPQELIDLLRFDFFEQGPIRDPFKVDEKEREFYKKMNTKYGLSEDLTYLLSTLYHNMVEYQEHMGKGGYGNVFVGVQKPYSVRIYLNTPSGKPTVDFAKEYIEKCIDSGLDYDAKFGFNTVSNDRTILYGREDELARRVAILEEIREEHPELISKFGSPIADCARLGDSYYGIAHAGMVSTKSGHCVQTYNDYFDSLCDSAFVLTKARIMLQRLFFDKTGLRPGEMQFVQNVALLKNFSAQHNAIAGNQSLMQIRHFPGIDYSKVKQDPYGQVFRTEGLSWVDIDKRLNDIMARKPELAAKIEEKKKAGEIDLTSEFASSMVILANFSQDRSLSAKSNVAVSKKMEDYLSKEKRPSKEGY